jgi:hypothetical protein
MCVARMEARVFARRNAGTAPDYASLHPGYDLYDLSPSSPSGQ